MTVSPARRSSFPAMMRRTRAACAALAAFAALAPRAEAQALTRVAATSLTLPAEAPTFGFRVERTLNGLVFDQPVAIVSPPGETNRLFIVEKPGRIIVIPDLANPSRQVFLDLTARVGDSSGEQGLLALAFHPQYASNGFFYVWYTLNATTAAGTGRHDRLARYRVSAGDPNRADATSEQALLTQRDQASNHNGGQLLFGPDGYLYLSLGDEGGANNEFDNAQRIDRDFFAGILRLDVDPRAGSLAPNPHAAVHAGAYAVPPDNPFVGATSFNGLAVSAAAVRTEYWATGLRNPWRMAFDPATGRLFVGDVGQNVREEIDVITRGGNYGWPFREGFIVGPSRSPPPGATFVEPLHDYPRSEGICVTGGLVYRGANFAQLYGAYLFSDYGSGKIWALRQPDNAASPQVQQLATDAGIVGFGVNPRNGDVLLADIEEGAIKRLVYDTTPAGAALPATLSATGAFNSLVTLAPAPGVVAYEPNVSFWSDHARKRRWFALRDTTSTFGFDARANWSLPAGAVWVKHFDLELTRGDPASARRIETRFLVKTSGGVYGLTYRWNDAQTEATLVPEAGADQDFTVVEGGGARTQTWHFPGRAECLACHTAPAGFALSFNARQLNRSFDFPGGAANEIAALAQAGYLAGAPAATADLPALAAASDVSQPLEWRARSYLDVNCAQCHRPGGPAPGAWEARASTPLGLAGIVNGALVDAGGDSANRVLAPGDAAHSRLLHRMAASHGATRMPPLATRERDLAGEALLADWIAQLGQPREPAPLLALSGRAVVGSGHDILIPGFIIQGSAPRRMLVRALGPSLAAAGVNGALPHPSLTVFSGGTALAANTRWNTAPNAADIRATSIALGAGALDEAVADSALLLTLAPGPYTAHVADTGGAHGIALFEVYDAETGASAGRLPALSVRARVGAGADVMIPGIAVGEGALRTLLIRAIGPGLEGAGVTDFLARPRLTLYAGPEAFLTNTGWETAANAGEIAAAATAIGLAPLAAGSADSALLVTLSPGTYTVHVVGADGGTGVALVDVYEAP